ncbi:MAG: hypothetical protein Q8N10_03530 [Phenylobacterium sp.]|uniref:hypothetical protein n=1 Tax=Phenylobacterium sp. TaxID=1871053 RepID=UPI0027181FF1|nr:hypothetical protein [Phenylobacterium sp.]MDO8912342.1 hypothetical protein [Phenylobacterium sp.]MDP3099554.1 hypothetical protein [Phenylobacterium sp.]
MSYQSMDHAGWVENSNAADNKMRGHRKGYRTKPETLAPFQGRVMDILGMVCGGIYNAPISWDKTEWNAGGGMFVTLRDDGFSTFDFYKLTALVFLCHEARIRCEISAKARGYLELGFWQRGHQGGMGQRHPNLDEAVTAFRAYLPADHSIVYAPTEGVRVAP